jgi:hypothetical protein
VVSTTIGFIITIIIVSLDSSVGIVMGCSGPQRKVRVPSRVRENILRNRLNLEPALILVLTKIRPRIEVLTNQKQA